MQICGLRSPRRWLQAFGTSKSWAEDFELGFVRKPMRCHICDHSSAHHDVIHANVRRKPSLKRVLDSHCKRCLALETSGSSVCILYCRCGTNTISDVDA